MNKDFERCCSFLADMIIKYAPEIKEEVVRFSGRLFCLSGRFPAQKRTPLFFPRGVLLYF